MTKGALVLALCAMLGAAAAQAQMWPSPEPLPRPPPQPRPVAREHFSDSELRSYALVRGELDRAGSAASAWQRRAALERQRLSEETYAAIERAAARSLSLQMRIDALPH